PKGDSTPRNRTRTGVVTNFYDSKGFGFIKDVESNESIFVHINNCEDDIGEGNRVTFETEKGIKGLTAVGVKIVK
nr:cold shock domain-containing protein [Bacteroidales bacterium]